jgi:arsenite methyltransferase
MPVETGSVDVVISNCVLNLVPNKAGAFAEMFRVLRPGGHPEADYLAMLDQVGFERVHIAEAKSVAITDGALAPHMEADEIAAFRPSGIVLKSITVIGSKPTAT